MPYLSLPDAKRAARSDFGWGARGRIADDQLRRYHSRVAYYLGKTSFEGAPADAGPPHDADSAAAAAALAAMGSTPFIMHAPPLLVHSSSPGPPKRHISELADELAGLLPPAAKRAALPPLGQQPWTRVLSIEQAGSGGGLDQGGHASDGTDTAPQTSGDTGHGALAETEPSHEGPAVEQGHPAGQQQLDQQAVQGGQQQGGQQQGGPQQGGSQQGAPQQGGPQPGLPQQSSPKQARQQQGTQAQGPLQQARQQLESQQQTHQQPGAEPAGAQQQPPQLQHPRQLQQQQQQQPQSQPKQQLQPQQQLQQPQPPPSPQPQPQLQQPQPPPQQQPQPPPQQQHQPLQQQPAQARTSAAGASARGASARATPPAPPARSQQMKQRQQAQQPRRQEQPQQPLPPQPRQQQQQQQPSLPSAWPPSTAAPLAPQQQATQAAPREIVVNSSALMDIVSQLVSVNRHHAMQATIARAEVFIQRTAENGGDVNVAMALLTQMMQHTQELSPSAQATLQAAQLPKEAPGQYPAGPPMDFSSAAHPASVQSQPYRPTVVLANGLYGRPPPPPIPVIPQVSLGQVVLGHLSGQPMHHGDRGAASMHHG